MKRRSWCCENRFATRAAFHLLLLTLTALALSVRPRLALAFDIFPEYQGLNEAELTRLESAADQDAEYQSQINSYTNAFAWEPMWWSRPLALDTSVGSITNQHFFIYTRLKLETDLLETLKFKFIQFAQREREVDQERQIFELSQQVSAGVRALVYGSPSLYKRENDLGFALELRTAGGWEHRLYQTKHDFTREGHNDQPDKFIGDEPLSYGWTVVQVPERQSGRGFFRAGARYDQPVLWAYPQQARFFRYEKTLLFGDWLVEPFGVRIQYDSTFKSQTGFGAQGASSGGKRQRLLARFSFSRGDDNDQVWFDSALMLAQRTWIDLRGSVVMHQNLMPSVTSRIQTVRRQRGFDHLQLGVEITDFKTFGDLSLVPENQAHQSVEGRLQAAYEFLFDSRARLFVAFNFDLDQWWGLPTFEGGNVRLRAEF